MLTALQIQNFKSWESITDMSFRPITGLFGSNSSGKTSIIQLLLLLKQTAESPDRAQVLNFGDERTQISLGGFRDIVFDHQIDRLVQWSLSWRTGEEIRISDPEKAPRVLFSGRDMSFSASIASPDGRKLFVKELEYRLGTNQFVMSRREGENRYDLAAAADGFQFRRAPGRAWPLPLPVKFYGFPDQVKAYFQNAGFLSDLELELEQLLNGIYYLGPLREYPRRQYTWGGGEPEDVGHRGERVVDALLASRERGSSISRGRGRRRMTLEEYVASWLQELGLIHSFSVSQIATGSNLYQIRVRKTRSSPEVLITDVGFGVSQLLPVLVLCFYVPRGSVVVLEQPEIHLHPAVQAALADVFIDAVQKRDVQIIVESHSEYLLQRLQRRIAEEVAPHDGTSLYFCDVEKDASQLVKLDVDIFGNITNWPTDFFGDSLGEMTAMTEAAARRKSRQTA